MVEEVNSKIANRLISLDAFRGITIALMLIADNLCHGICGLGQVIKRQMP